MDPITAALSYGATALASGALSEAGKDLYGRLRRAVTAFVSAEDVAKLEETPASDGRRVIVAEQLAAKGKADDPDLAKLAESLTSALREAAAAGATGIEIEDVEAVNVRLRDIAATGTGASIKRTKLAGDIEASGIEAGRPPGKQ